MARPVAQHKNQGTVGPADDGPVQEHRAFADAPHRVSDFIALQQSPIGRACIQRKS